MRLGVLGGMFDPIHLGHLRAAENARRDVRLDRVLFVPAGVPPHRPQAQASAFDRYAMVALATAGEAGFLPWDGELRRGAPSYTVDTLRALREENRGVEVVLIVGSDNLRQLPTWKEPDEIFALAEVAVVERPGAVEPAGAGPARVTRVTGTGLAIASREVRERVRRGEGARGLVPERVADYIEKRGLYR